MDTTSSPTGTTAHPVTAVVLAAGFGSRLGTTVPKTLVRLADGATILGRLLAAVDAALPGARVCAVVGHKAPMILEAEPGLLFAYNAAFESTNTAKSLLHALRLCPDGDVLWSNGDVVCDPEVVARVAATGARGRSCVAVDRSSVGDEEVKYTLADGVLAAIGKQVPDALGEAVGVNYVTARDRPALVAALERVGDTDYFERGIELTLADGVRWHPVDVTDLWAVEVDFPEDLDHANERVADARARSARVSR